MVDGQVQLDYGVNEFDSFISALPESACAIAKPAPALVTTRLRTLVSGSASRTAYDDIVPVCRLRKSSAEPE